MSSGNNAGQNHKYILQVLWKCSWVQETLTDQNCVPEEIKSRLNSVNACYHSAKNLFYPFFLSKNIQHFIFTYCLIWVWNLLNTLREEGRPGVIANRVLGHVFGSEDKSCRYSRHDGRWRKRRPVGPQIRSWPFGGKFSCRDSNDDSSVV